MKKEWWILIISILAITILFFFIGINNISVKLGTSAESVKNNELNSRMEIKPEFLDDEGVQVSLNEEYSCSCIGLNLRGLSEDKKTNSRCYGIKFNCFKRCNVYILNKSSLDVTEKTSPCDCSQSCMRELVNK